MMQDKKELVTISARIPKDDWVFLKLSYLEDKKTIANIIQDYLKEYIKKQKAKKAKREKA